MLRSMTGPRRAREGAGSSVDQNAPGGAIGAAPEMLRP